MASLRQSRLTATPCRRLLHADRPGLQGSGSGVKDGITGNYAPSRQTIFRRVAALAGMKPHIPFPNHWASAHPRGSVCSDAGPPIDVRQTLNVGDGCIEVCFCVTRPLAVSAHTSTVWALGVKSTSAPTSRGPLCARIRPYAKLPADSKTRAGEIAIEPRRCC